MSDENLALNNRLLAHRVKELEAQRDEARNQGIPWPTVKEHKQQLDRMRDRAEKAEAANKLLDRDLRHLRAEHSALDTAYDEMSDELTELKSAMFRQAEWRDYIQELGRELDERNNLVDALMEERDEARAFVAELTESEQLWEEVARRDEAEERASQHWEAAKTYYRMYDAAMEEVSDLQVELWELKRALRTLGGERPNQRTINFNDLTVDNTVEIVFENDSGDRYK